MDKIILKGIRFYGYHGTHAYERKYGQEFVADVELYADLALSGKSDKLKDTVDYVKAYKIVVDTGTKNKFALMEALAEHIAEQLLKMKKVSAVKVLVRKPKNLIGGLIESAGVEIERNKSGCSVQRAGSRKQRTKKA